MAPAHVESRAAGACRDSDHADRGAILRRYRSGIFQAVQNGGRIEHQFQRVHELRADPVQPRGKFCNAFRFKIIPYSPRQNQRAPETVPAEFRGHIQVFAADAPAVGRRGKERHVSRQSPQIADMVCDAFQFQCERSQCLRPFRRACAGQGFEYPRISGSRCRGTVSGGGFHEVNRPFVGTADQHFFNAAVLISKFDFKRIDIFAHTLKTEMPRFDHACVNRPHRDLMGGGAFHRKIIRDSGDRFAGTPPYIRCAVHGFVETDRLEPGMPQRHDAGLFGNFALEPVKLRALFRQGFIRGTDD